MGAEQPDYAVGHDYNQGPEGGTYVEQGESFYNALPGEGVGDMGRMVVHVSIHGSGMAPQEAAEYTEHPDTGHPVTQPRLLTGPFSHPGRRLSMLSVDAAGSPH